VGLTLSKKQFDFWLVKEVGSERAIVHNLATTFGVAGENAVALIGKGSYGKMVLPPLV